MQNEKQPNWTPERIDKELVKAGLSFQKKQKARPMHKPIRTYCREPRLLPDGTIKEAYA